jgi:glycosyltransferase involved in cell wall biosynthesis
MSSEPRVGVLVVAYNAASTLASVLDRIPAADRARIEHVLVSDDHSADDTYEIGLGAEDRALGFELTTVRQPRNLGYGGNQKFGYTWAIEHELDVVVMLHGDGQYAPEHIGDLYGPIVRGEADVVLGSRMLVPGAARAGGMPRYKYVGNRILTRVQNAVTGLALSEWHSGYRAFSTAALRRIPFTECSNGFDFDTEVLLQLHDTGARIVEVPIPTYYGDEICYVAGIPYARDVVLDALRYRLERIGFGSGSLAVASRAYELKPDAGSSHGRLLARAVERPAGRVLDLGCGEGHLADRLRQAGHHVTGVDVQLSPAAKGRLDHAVQADLDEGIPPEVAGGEPFDLVLAADVLEHVRDPKALLAGVHDVLRRDGRLLVSVPNFGHWYPRLRTTTGHFGYDRRGILDEDHVRFFTRRSFERLVHRSGWHILDRSATGLPFDVADRGGRGAGTGATLRRAVGWLDDLLVRTRPTLFGYQLLYELEPARRRAHELRT